ncbi:MAG: hypothetical protein ABI262_17740 [Microcoleus sp.]
MSISTHLGQTNRTRSHLLYRVEHRGCGGFSHLRPRLRWDGCVWLVAGVCSLGWREPAALSNQYYVLGWVSRAQPRLFQLE